VASSSSAVHVPSGEGLDLVRTFDAPRALVWKMWQDPEHMVRWHGPEGFWLDDCEIDFRVGGKWRRTMSHSPGHAHLIYGTYLEIEEPSRLSFTYINGYDEFEMVVTLDFAEVDGRTVMHFKQAPFVSDEERSSHGWGWESGLSLLAAYVIKVKAAGGEPVGRPRKDGVAEDIIAARRRREEVQNADAAKDGRA
jgi:uncharacterized protein YndB with AHSA1/START domain